MTNGERYKIFKEWFNSIGFPEMHSSYKDAMWRGFEAGHRKASKINDSETELLEALMDIITCLDKGAPLDEENCGHEFDKARAAIAKSLGESK